MLSQVVIEKRFKPFVEDRLRPSSKAILGLVGHPGHYPPCPRALSEPVTLAIGPEGGWIPYEIDLFGKAGLQPVQLGERILRAGDRRHRPAGTTLLNQTLPPEQARPQAFHLPNSSGDAYRTRLARRYTLKINMLFEGVAACTHGWPISWET